MAPRSFDIAQEQGSKEFLAPCVRLGLPAKVKYLAYGDFAFYGNGPSGLVRVGIERKTISEMLGDKARRRFVGRQLPGMVRRYDYRFLVVEGSARIDPDYGDILDGKDLSRRHKDLLTIWRPARYADNHSFDRYVKEAMTVRLCCGLHIIPTATSAETACLLHSIYRWFQKEWHEHRSHLAVEQAEVEKDWIDPQLLDERTLRRQTFNQWPFVGWKRSARVSRYFTSIAQAATADEETWMEALGVKEGRTMARTLVNMLRGKTDHHDAKGS